MQLPTEPVLSAIFSNLAKAAEKQQIPEDADFFTELSGEFWKSVSVPSEKATISSLSAGVESDLNEGYPRVSALADGLPDPGAQRCVKWGEKATSIQKSLLSRYASKGEALFDGKGLYVCEACGFIALADDFPELCPVCKAPKSRFSKVK
jgi:rubrerythrin